jgi:hypothetical protein
MVLETIYVTRHGVSTLSDVFLALLFSAGTMCHGFSGRSFLFPVNTKKELDFCNLEP